MRVSKMHKTALWMFIEIMFGILMLVAMVVFEGNYPFWMNDHPVTFIPFLGFIVSGCIMVYYLFCALEEK